MRSWTGVSRSTHHPRLQKEIYWQARARLVTPGGSFFLYNAFYSVYKGPDQMATTTQRIFAGYYAMDRFMIDEAGITRLVKKRPQDSRRESQRPDARALVVE
jgi:hypothetical protein